MFLETLARTSYSMALLPMASRISFIGKGSKLAGELLEYLPNRQDVLDVTHPGP